MFVDDHSEGVLSCAVHVLLSVGSGPTQNFYAAPKFSHTVKDDIWEIFVYFICSFVLVQVII